MPPRRGVRSGRREARLRRGNACGLLSPAAPSNSNGFEFAATFACAAARSHSRALAARASRMEMRHIAAYAGRSAAVVNESAKYSFSGSLHCVVKSRRAASTITGTPQA